MSAYPKPGWSSVTNFRYLAPLVLVRDIAAVKSRTRADAAYRLGEDYRASIEVDGKRLMISAPAGMATDLSSVPRLAWTLTGIGRVGPHLEASIVHDWLYIAWQHEGLSAAADMRRFADAVFLVGMAAAKVPWLRRTLIYRSVRIGGHRAFFS